MSVYLRFRWRYRLLGHCGSGRSGVIPCLLGSVGVPTCLGSGAGVTPIFLVMQISCNTGRLWCLDRGMLKDLPCAQVEVQTGRGKNLRQSWIKQDTTMLHMIWIGFSPGCTV